MKPPRAQAVAMHQDGAYVDYLDPAAMMTCWVALDDASAAEGTLVYARGSHKWPLNNVAGEFHAPTKDYRWAMLQAAENAGVTDPELVVVEVPAGGCAFHHGRTWHGLCPTTRTEGMFHSIGLHTSDWEVGLQTIWEFSQQHPEWQGVPLLNSHTSYFWGANPPQADMQAYLDGKPITPPSPDWSVGHFALLAGQLQGNAKTLYAVLDTYPHFGGGGLHVQPPAVLAQSLMRLNHSFEGGVALFVAEQVRSQVESLLSAVGFTIAPWDNGSPMPSLE